MFREPVPDVGATEGTEGADDGENGTGDIRCCGGGVGEGDGFPKIFLSKVEGAGGGGGER